MEQVVKELSQRDASLVNQLEAPLESSLSSLPPSYEDVSETELKQPGPDPHETEVKELATQDSTEVKGAVAPIDIVELKQRVSQEDADEDEDFNPSEMEEVMKSLRRLQEEQDRLKVHQEKQERENEALKRRMEEQLTQFQSLMDSKPKLQRRVETMRKSKAVGLSVLAASLISSGVCSSMQKPSPDSGIVESIYVQMEQLYSNFTRLNWISVGREAPAKPEEADDLESVYSEAEPDDLHVYSEVGVKREVTHDVTRVTKRKSETDDLRQKNKELTRKVSQRNTETESLRKENDDLKKKIQELEQNHRHFERTLSEPAGGHRGASPCRTGPVYVAGKPQPAPRKRPPPPALTPMETTFQWIIHNYEAKMAREMSQINTWETSSPFYLMHNGYRCQLEAYLNGNGTALNCSMSVFMRVIKGDYDDTLKWPVVLCPVFILVNQTDNSSDSLKAIGQTTSHFSFEQPTESGETDCWGLIEFVAHDLIRDRKYIMNDRVVLRCRIQTVRP